MEPFIFAENTFFLVKTANKVDTLEIFASETFDFQWVHFVGFFCPYNEIFSKNEWFHQKAGEILNKIEASNFMKIIVLYVLPIFSVVPQKEHG